MLVLSRKKNESVAIMDANGKVIAIVTIVSVDRGVG